MNGLDLVVNGLFVLSVIYFFYSYYKSARTLKELFLQWREKEEIFGKCLDILTRTVKVQQEAIHKLTLANVSQKQAFDKLAKRVEKLEKRRCK